MKLPIEFLEQMAEWYIIKRYGKLLQKIKEPGQFWKLENIIINHIPKTSKYFEASRGQDKNRQVITSYGNDFKTTYNYIFKKYKTKL